MNTSKISIVMAYFNRLQQFEFTLKRLVHFNFKGEIVVADDFSADDQKVDILKEKYKELDIKVVKPRLKTMSPSHTFNCAIKEAKNEIIIITNPECAWVHDIGSYVSSNLKKKDYMVFGCLNATEDETKKIQESSNLENIKGDCSYTWYQHSEYNPRCLHFCLAIHRTDLDNYLGGGFDEQFNDGYYYDDDEILYRARKHLNVIQVDELYVIHQYHSRSFNYTGHKNKEDRKSLINRNYLLFEEVKRTYGTEDYKGILPKVIKY